MFKRFFESSRRHVTGEQKKVNLVDGLFAIAEALEGVGVSLDELASAARNEQVSDGLEKVADNLKDGLQVVADQVQSIDYR